jgi:SAM-dependent methyltransferase
MGSFKKMIQKVKDKWKNVGRSHYWGDNLDIRYYLCLKVKAIKDKRVLDIGCGSGIILSELDGSNDKFGMDLSREYMDIVPKIDKAIKFIIADMNSMPYKKGVFDVIMLNAMLPLVSDKQGLIASIYDLLAVDGLFLVTTHNRDHCSYRDEDSLLSFRDTENLLSEKFDINITGFNPFPRFPYFVPNVIADKIPYVWEMLTYFSDRGLFVKKSRALLIEARKKKSRAL